VALTNESAQLRNDPAVQDRVSRDMMIFAAIGAKALYLLLVWLLSAAIGSWLFDRKGYGERVGLAFGLILSAIGLIIVLLLPGRPGSKWREEGWLPPQRRRVG
jgi:hypothetical protein